MCRPLSLTGPPQSQQPQFEELAHPGLDEKRFVEQVEASTGNSEQDDSGPEESDDDSESEVSDDDSGSQVVDDDSDWEDSSSTTALRFQRVPPKRPACSSLLTDQFHQLQTANVSPGGGEGIILEFQPIREDIEHERAKTGCSDRMFNNGGSRETAEFQWHSFRW